MTHPLSLHHLTMIEASPIELIDAAAAGKFQYVGLRLFPADASETREAALRALRSEAAIRQALDRTGVRLLDVEVVWLQAATDIEGLRPILEVGARLGAKHVIAIAASDDSDRVQSQFNELCDLSMSLGLRVGLEFLTYFPIGTLPQALEIIRRSGRPNAQLVVDPLQYVRSGALAQDLNKVEKTLLTYMQLCDGPLQGPTDTDGKRSEARTARLLPGEGEFPLALLLACFGPEAILSVEAPTIALRGLPYAERARRIGDATRAFLATLEGDAAARGHAGPRP